jgi:hypothetical protein
LEEEQYLGGMASANMKKGLMSGYGIYATDRRIIGTKKRSGVLKGFLVASALGGKAGTVKGNILRGALAQAFTKNESAKQIQDLEKNKDFDIYKENIAEIEIKKSGAMHGGHIKVKPKQGKEIEVSMHGREEFGHMVDLMRAFYPEALKVQE